MRLTTTLLVCLFLLSAGVLHRNVSTVNASAVQSDHPPEILNARVNGKKLIVTGQNFAHGAVILVDGVAQKTKNDSDFPSTMLIAKKAGKKIPNNTVVSIQIQSGGETSDQFGMFKGLIVTLADVGKPILLKTGDRFLLFLDKGGYLFAPSVLDTTILQKVDDVEIIPGSQGVFEAKRAGSTKLNAIGELPCHKTIPACLAPTLNFEFDVVVADFRLE
ncbi:MAG TPA: hypothetical protein VNS63_13740 [Blastocatellia bacterium]|nr:hypothetical protein [Blastocatellia bacterium]